MLVSWALPKGLPDDPKRNHLAVHTEDHPLEYATFAGDDPGGAVRRRPGRDLGPRHVRVRDVDRRRGEDRAARRRVAGPVRAHPHRRQELADPPDGGHAPQPRSPRAAAPALVQPMLATLGQLPADDDGYAYETKWDGVRAIAYVQRRRAAAADPQRRRRHRRLSGAGRAGGRPRRRGRGPRRRDRRVRPRRAGLVRGAATADAPARPAARSSAWRDRHRCRTASSTCSSWTGTPPPGCPVPARRELLQSLELERSDTGRPRPTTAAVAPRAGRAVEGGTEGIMAKRLDSRYTPGRRSPAWMKVKNIRTQEVVVGGWRPGQGNRADTIGSLLLGIPAEGGLAYVGQVGTGFTRDSPRRPAAPALRGRSPQDVAVRRRGAHAGRARTRRWVTPTAGRRGRASPSGPATAGCAIRRGAASDPTRRPAT